MDGEQSFFLIYLIRSVLLYPKGLNTFDFHNTKFIVCTVQSGFLAEYILEVQPLNRRMIMVPKQSLWLKREPDRKAAGYG